MFLHPPRRAAVGAAGLRLPLWKGLGLCCPATGPCSALHTPPVVIFVKKPEDTKPELKQRPIHRELVGPSGCPSLGVWMGPWSQVLAAFCWADGCCHGPSSHSFWFPRPLSLSCMCRVRTWSAGCWPLRVRRASAPARTLPLPVPLMACLSLCVCVCVSLPDSARGLAVSPAPRRGPAGSERGAAAAEPAPPLPAAPGAGLPPKWRLVPALPHL